MEKQWLNYHHLYYFTIIAQEGAIAKAAKKLRLGQPTLSTQLTQFEDHLGFPLFERKKKRLHLTEAGRVALDYANEIFRLGSEMIDTLNDRKNDDRLKLQIGCMDSIPKDYVLKMLQAARNYLPCQISCIEGTSEHLLQELKAHRLDLILTNHPVLPQKQDGIYNRKIGEFPVGVYGEKKFQKLSKNFPSSLNEQPIILSNHNPAMRNAIEQYFKRKDIQVDVVAEVQDTSLQKLMGMNGIGLVPLADPAGETAVEYKELYKIGSLPGIHEEVWMVLADRRIQNPLAEWLMKEFKLNNK